MNRNTGAKSPERESEPTIGNHREFDQSFYLRSGFKRQASAVSYLSQVVTRPEKLIMQYWRLSYQFLSYIRCLSAVQSAEGVGAK